MAKLTGKIIKTIPIGKHDKINVTELKEMLKPFDLKVREVQTEGGTHETLVEISKDGVSVYLDSLTNEKRWG